MSIKTPQEYREKVTKQKKIVLPSGLECVIRPVPTMLILELTQVAEKFETTLDKYLLQNFVEALDSVVPSSVVSPTILPSRQPGDTSIDENALYLDELIIGDLNELFLEIVKLSGIEKEDVERFKSFPEQRPG